jgi:hypothetical protein
MEILSKIFSGPYQFTYLQIKKFQFNKYHYNENISLVQQKSILLWKKYEEYNEICKNIAMHILWNPPWRVRQRWGKRKVLQKIVKVYSSWRITGMYTLVMAAVFHGRNPMNKTVW